MRELESHDVHCLSAAVGWKELGNPTEALAELDKISTEGQQHEQVLEVRWGVCADRRDWSAALTVAEAIMRASPDDASGWMHYAYALRRAPGGSVGKAWDFLLPIAEKFPDEVIVPYNLSCYACVMQQLDEARA